MTYNTRTYFKSNLTQNAARAAIITAFTAGVWIAQSAWALDEPVTSDVAELAEVFVGIQRELEPQVKQAVLPSAGLLVAADVSGDAFKPVVPSELTPTINIEVEPELLNLFNACNNGLSLNSLQCGTGSHASGSNGSTALGNDARASQSFTTAVGNDARASATSASSYGHDATASGANSSAIGAQSIASLRNTVALGAYSQATGLGSVSIGAGNQNAEAARASGRASVAIGSAVYTDSSAVLFLGAQASGQDSVAVGTRSVASATDSTVLGHGATSTSSNAVAIGADARAIGVNGTAIGDSSMSLARNTVSLGASAHATAVNATAIGAVSIASGIDSTALGNSAVASGTNSFALGADSDATAMDSMALGRDSLASASRTVAVGSMAEATDDDAVAIGVNSRAMFSGSTAIGTGAMATMVNQMMFGTSNVTYVMPGLTSGTSLAQQGELHGIVTVDVNGSLSSDGGALEGRVAALENEALSGVERVETTTSRPEADSDDTASSSAVESTVKTGNQTSAEGLDAEVSSDVIGSNLTTSPTATATAIPTFQSSPLGHAANDPLIAANTTAITANTAAIDVNKTAIAVNTARLDTAFNNISANSAAIAGNTQEISKLSQGLAAVAALPDMYLNSDEKWSAAGGVSVYGSDVGIGGTLAIRGNKNWSFGASAGFGGDQATGKVQVRYGGF
ncbi:MAG: hypothetical protein ACSHXY_15475 [Alphaproteobacteria bacterium]